MFSPDYLFVSKEVGVSVVLSIIFYLVVIMLDLLTLTFALLNFSLLLLP